MSQPRPLFWLRAGQTVSNSFVLSAKQSSRTSNFNVFWLTRPGIEPPTSRMPGERSTTTLPGRGCFLVGSVWTRRAVCDCFGTVCPFWCWYAVKLTHIQSVKLHVSHVHTLYICRCLPFICDIPIIWYNLTVQNRLNGFWKCMPAFHTVNILPNCLLLAHNDNHLQVTVHLRCKSYILVHKCNQGCKLLFIYSQPFWSNQLML